MRDAALFLFDDPDECNCPSSASIAWLRRQGAELEDIIRPWAIAAARVRFDPDVARYEPSPLGEPAFIIAILAANGIIDAAAWHPPSNRIGTRLGLGAALGEGQIGRDGLGTTGLPIPVWRTPLGWLRSRRLGIVLADPELAAHRLAGCMISAEDSAHAATLQRALAVPPPTIVIGRTRQHAAA